MLKKLCLAAGFAALVALVGCTAAQQQTIDAVAANAKAQVSQACTIVQPVLLNLSASVPGDANLALLAADNGKLCAAVTALDATSVQSLINTVIPQAIGLAALLPIDAATQTTVKIALGAASLALSNWLLVYGQSATTVAPASGAVAS